MDEMRNYKAVRQLLIKLLYLRLSFSCILVSVKGDE